MREKWDFPHIPTCGKCEFLHASFACSLSMKKTGVYAFSRLRHQFVSFQVDSTGLNVIVVCPNWGGGSQKIVCWPFSTFLAFRGRHSIRSGMVTYGVFWSFLHYWFNSEVTSGPATEGESVILLVARYDGMGRTINLPHRNELMQSFGYSSLIDLTS